MRLRIVFLLLLFFVLARNSIFCSLTCPSISFCIADIKFDGEKLKICEFGQGVFSTFRGYDTLHGKGALWSLVWAYLAQFKKPVLVVSSQLNGTNMERIAVDELRQRGGNVFSSLSDLIKDKRFKQIVAQDKDKQERMTISDYSGFVIVRQDSFYIQNFIKKYPSILFFDEKSSRFVGNKRLTHLLFDGDSDLMQYRPRCKICSKNKCVSQAMAIFKDMPSEKYVIKPINSSMGRGIAIVEKDFLKDALFCVASKKSELPVLKDSALDYWQLDKNDSFLVEEFVASMPVYVNDKWYDPTMRVAFIVTTESGATRVTFLDAYWKLPAKAISEDGTLTEVHKSHIVKGGKSSCVVSLDDYTCVTRILDGVLPKVFNKMLAA